MKKLLAIFLFLVSFSVFAVTPEEKSREPKAAININKADFISSVMDYEKNTQEWVFKGDKPCLIDFYADWCGPCRITSPILEELAQEYKGKINVYKVDVDQERELAQVFGVSGIPAFLYCPMEGKPTMTSGIAKDKDQTKEMFRNYIETILLKNE
jgi:thioredoxin